MVGGGRGVEVSIGEGNGDAEVVVSPSDDPEASGRVILGGEGLLSSAAAAGLMGVFGAGDILVNRSSAANRRRLISSGVKASPLLPPPKEWPPPDVAEDSCC